MPVLEIDSTENVDAGFKAESTPGTFATGAYAKFLTTGASVEYPSESVSDDSVGDHGGPISDRTTTRGAGGSFPMNLRYDDCMPFIEAACRDEKATAATITGSSDIDLVTNGTHLDGSTGIQIQTAAGGFDALLEYGGATTNGAEGLLMKMSGWTNAGNNQFVMIKAVHEAGGLARIDIWPGYGGGQTGDPFGAPKIAEADKSAVLKVGEAVRNHQSDGSLTSTVYSFLFDFFTHGTAARFCGMAGWAANDIQLAVSGKGPVVLTVNGNGCKWS